jgi:hypothetical protein
MHAQPVYQVVPLGNHAYLGAQAPQPPAAQTIHFNPIHGNASRKNRKKSADGAKQRCLARAAGPKDSDLFSPADAQGNSIQHGSAFAVTANNEVIYLKHGG